MDASAAHPVALAELIGPGKEVESLRDLFCPHYGACLDEAVGSEWTSWSCDECPLFVGRAVVVTRH